MADGNQLAVSNVSAVPQNNQLSFEDNQQWFSHLVGSGQLGGIKTVEAAYTIAQMGKELGFQPMISFNYIINIRGRLTLSVKAQKALLLRAGIRYETIHDGACLYSDGNTTPYQIVPANGAVLVDYISEIKFTRKFADGSVMVEYGRFSYQDGVAAGLVKDDSNWVKYRRQMISARAFANGADKIAPDVLAGMYAAEELVDGKGYAESVVAHQENMASPLDDVDSSDVTEGDYSTVD